MKKRAFELMKTWCDTLLTYRVTSPHPAIDGAMVCPACHVIHGRIADLAFPLALLYVETGEARYIDAADKFVTWTDMTLSRPDGSVRNDAGNEWKGISAFLALSLGEALYHFDGRLPSEVQNRWMKLFVRISEFIYVKLSYTKPNINYFAGMACELAMAWKLTGDEKYLIRARDMERICREHFDGQGMFFGESCDNITPKGCRYIDAAYNIEESLPHLLRYATLTGEGMDFYRERMRDGLEFLLPDGGIDDSWSSRQNKWTWWGSRTSDGAVEGLALCLDDPMLADACERVLSLYEKCTHDGLLSLPMAKQAGEPTCLHHSFCHAKALAVLALAENVKVSHTVLPCEQEYGVKLFQNGNVALISHKGWRATVSTCDVVYGKGCENGGGSMTLLMHGTTPICASTMREYRAVEPHNMQFLKRSDQTPCMTPRVIFEDGDSLTDNSAVLSVSGEAEVTVRGTHFTAVYSFGDYVSIRLKSDKKASFMLPIIVSDDVSVTEGCVRIGAVEVYASDLHCDKDARMFNQVGGFIWLPIAVDIVGETAIKICFKE